MTDTILIVEHDPAIQALLHKVVCSNGMTPNTAFSYSEMFELLRQTDHALILIDIAMYDMDGFEVIRKLRSQGMKTPIIMLSERQDDYELFYGLDIGADDYVVKPFNPLILGAKIKALIRRSNDIFPRTNSVITAGPFQYNTSTLRFYKNRNEIILSSKENAIIKLFMDNINRVFSKDMIYEQIWGASIIDENTIMVYINRLRKKIEDDPAKPNYIQTVRGLGYRFVI